MLGSGGEAQIVKALDRQHGRFVALKIRPVRDEAAREDLLGEARVLLAPAAASGAAARARGLLRPRRLRRRDGLGRRHRPGDAARPTRAPRARAVERARLSRPGGRGAHPPALAVAAGHPRRRQARQPDPDQGRPDQARRLRPVVGAGRAARARRHARLPRARAGRRRRPVARERRLRARGDRVRAADRLRPRRRAARPGRASTRRRRSSSRPRSGSAWRPTRRAAGDAGRAGRAPAGRLGGRAADRRRDVLLLGHRGLDRAVGGAPRGDGRGARAPRRADRRRRRGPRRKPDQVDGRGRLDRLGVRLGAGARSRPRSPPTGRWPPSSGRPGIRIAVRWGIHTGEAERRDADHFGPSVNLAARAARAGRRRPDLPLLGDRRAGRRRTCPRAARSSTSDRTGSRGSARRSASTRCAGPGVDAPPPATECPYRGLLAFEAGRRAFFFGREEVVAELVGRLAPAAAARRRRRIGQRQVVGPARRRSSPPRAPARSPGSTTPRS